MVGLKVISRGGKMKGRVVGEIYQWCAGCQAVRGKLIAKWPDGHRTYLCPTATSITTKKIQIL
jgi:hypothetical protein